MKNLLIILSITIIALATIIGIRWFGGRPDSPNEQLILPIRLFEKAQQIAGNRPIFTNPSVRGAAEAILAREQDRLPTIDTSAAVGSPSQWRREDREKRFGAVVFMGREAEFAPLLLHLKESPDWQLAYIDNFGLIFEQVPTAGEISVNNQKTDFTVHQQIRSLTKIPSPKEAMPLNLTPEEGAIYLSQMGEVLTTFQDYGNARRYFEEAWKKAPQQPEVLARYASFLALRGEWQRAREMADQSLQLRKNYLPALQAKLQILLAQKNEAGMWDTALRLKKIAPDDPFSLFLFAKAANTVGAFAEESDALEQLIVCSQAHGLPTAYYQLYLGQSYARQGLANQATKALQTALNSHQLDAEQQKQVEEILEAINPTQGTEGQEPKIKADVLINNK